MISFSTNQTSQPPSSITTKHTADHLHLPNRPTHLLFLFNFRKTMQHSSQSTNNHFWTHFQWLTTFINHKAHNIRLLLPNRPTHPLIVLVQFRKTMQHSSQSTNNHMWTRTDDQFIHPDIATRSACKVSARDASTYG